MNRKTWRCLGAITFLSAATALFLSAEGTTFRVSAETDASTVVNSFATWGGTWYGGGDSTLDDEGDSDSNTDFNSSNGVVCHGGVCCACHYKASDRAAVELSKLSKFPPPMNPTRASSLARKHLSDYFLRSRYSPKVGEQIKVGNKGELVSRRKGVLVVFEGGEFHTLGKNDDLVLTRGRNFILRLPPTPVRPNVKPSRETEAK